MRWLHYKSKQLFSLLLKVALLSTICLFIYHKLTQNNELSWADFNLQLQHIQFSDFVFLLVLSVFNWSLETFKWKKLVHKIEFITFRQSAFQLLSSHAIAILTPNRIGEYGAKPMFFSKNYWKKIVLYNFFGNMSQLLVTVLFGILAIILLLNNSAFSLSFISFKNILIANFILIAFLFFLWKSSYVKEQLYRLQKSFCEFSNKNRIEILGLSLARYLVFSHQFYFLLLLLNVEISYFDAMSCIFSMYFLASVLPSIFFLEAIVKGGIAVWLFSFFQVNALPVLVISSLMWLFNFAFPAIMGSLLLFKFQPRFQLNFAKLWK
ncbi:MAG: hypothetical protein CMH15_15935 [Mesonia sp.]|uniref:Uncharacterized protein n=1 Tax=Mesonia oceanica TaxID=2687242 RepID=A0AC61YAQ4_9FLAO|nr:hypothetical protein [Mesonia sp.]MAQ42505.1 hypothetical protein [Mesonia sp.]MBJ96868.1 hypothetical protein [Flavobacteriaceae bacterium]VVV01479.1 hypothetical protein FVB9532_02771 [Mesonia oceanica]|tara:strand:+ start:7615 stop:8580 length:966 start_codon:yes stop_codon:yes gene_type:complete